MKTENLALPSSEKLNLLSNLATMINAGLTMAEAVEALLGDATGTLKVVLTGIQEDITQGKALHMSLSKYPRIFDSVTVALIKASEESGTVHIVLKDVKNTVKKDIEFMDKIKSTLTYPVIIFIVFTGVLLLLLAFVIPKITTVFLRLRVTLPLPTKILIALSNIVVNYTIPTIITTVSIVILLFFLYKRQKKLLMSVFLSLPYISAIAIQVDLTRFCRSMHLLLTSAIPVYTSLELTSAIVVKHEVRDAIMRTKEYVGGGRGLAEGLRGHKAIPSIMLKIIEVGERSGTLEQSMQDLAEYFDYQVTKTLQFAITVFEPMILVVVGVVIGSMMIAIMAPIYNLIGQVGSFR